MGLSDDQRAMLRLLAQGDVSVEDIAALKGKSVEQVKAEIAAALSASQAETEATAAEPEPPAPAPAEPAPAPAQPAPAPPAQPSEPDQPPRPPAPARKRRAASRPAVPAVPAGRRRVVALAGAALLLVAIVIGAIALFGDNGSGSAGINANEEASAIAEDDKITRARLLPPDGEGDANGNAIFGRMGEEEVVLQVTAEGLEPTEAGQSYAIWLYRSPKLALRVGAVQAEEGTIVTRLPIPAEVLAYVAGGAFKDIAVSLTDDAAYKRELNRARKAKSLPRYSGETVLRGEIVGPIVEAGKAAKNQRQNQGR